MSDEPSNCEDYPEELLDVFYETWTGHVEYGMVFDDFTDEVRDQ